MTDGVDTPMHSVHASHEPAGSHRIVADPETAHLGDGDHSILPLGSAGDQCVGWGDFSVHFTDKSPHLATSPPPIARLSACCAC